MDKKKGLGLLGAGVLALAGLVGGGLYLHNKKGKEGTEQESNTENVDDESNVEE